eukprot:11178992-Lingulodinium_polyedra.AAC.1
MTTLRTRRLMTPRKSATWQASPRTTTSSKPTTRATRISGAAGTGCEKCDATPNREPAQEEPRLGNGA